MRKIPPAGLVLVAAMLAGATSPAYAAKCNIPPPSWWFAPKVTQTYSYSGGGYASSCATSHTFSAHRRSTIRYVSAPPYRDPFARW
jgi:hypothetical protein